MRNETYFFIVLWMLTSALKITRFEVPRLPSPGKSVRLTCVYDLGSENLYSVKWYKDKVEFFRFFPSLYPQFMAFPAPGIDIDLLRSGANTVYLRNLSLESEGRYTCQVSADEPFFGCVQVHRDIVVHIPPISSPQITGSITDGGDNLTLKCSSGKSKPAANLSWYVNDIPVPKLKGIHEVIRHSDRLESTFASIVIPLESEHIPQEEPIRFTCAATVADVVTSVSKELFVSRSAPQMVLELQTARQPKLSAATVLAVSMLFIQFLLKEYFVGLLL